MFASIKRKLATIDRFAQELVAMISQHLPSACVGDLEQAGSRKQAMRLADRATRRAQRFVLDNHLGFLLNTHLANKVKWGLRDQGYGEPFIELVTVSLAVRPHSMQVARSS